MATKLLKKAINVSNIFQAPPFGTLQLRNSHIKATSQKYSKNRQTSDREEHHIYAFRL